MTAKNIGIYNIKNIQCTVWHFTLWLLIQTDLKQDPYTLILSFDIFSGVF